MATHASWIIGGDWFSGTDAHGVYTHAEIKSELYLEGIDGSPARPFWSEMPPNVAAPLVWTDEFGGWLVAGNERFDDGQVHGSDMARPAFTADAIYVASRTIVERLIKWQIVRIACP